MASSRSAVTRVCIYAAVSADADWLAQVASGLPSGTRVDDSVSSSVLDAATALRAAAKAFPGDDLVLLRAGTVLPPFWFTRLTAALPLPNVLVASALDNIDSARSPLAPAARSSADPCHIDALCYLHGGRVALDWPTFSPLLSAWNGAALASCAIEKIHDETLPALFAPFRCVLPDFLYVADPNMPLRGPKLAAPGVDAAPPSTLGALREHVVAALSSKPARANQYPGLDGKPVVLHVLHGWGGGAQQFVRDLANNDTQRHHLIFTASGHVDRHRYGEVVELFDATHTQPALRQLHLSNPIASTSLAHRDYAEFLADICRDFGVDAIVVASLIGHSLDVLRSGLPTFIFIHDFYPLWPLLHGNLDDASMTFDATRLRADLARAGADFEFAERDADYWIALADAFAQTAVQAHATLIAPSRAAMKQFTRLQPRLSALPQHIIAHGIAPWPTSVRLPLPAPPPRDRLRLVVLGRVRRGKAANLLRAMLPALSEHAELFLLGAGLDGHEFFGRRDVHILLNYQRDDLPQLLSHIAADAALIVPDFGETFSYTLSELNSCGIPAIATNLGALGERIDDGVDGFLTPASAESILATIARLRRDRRALDTVRANLAKRSTRSVADMTADYRTLLPTTNLHPAMIAPMQANTDRLIVQTQADALGRAQRQIIALKDDVQARQNELESRAEWAFDLNRQIARATAAMNQLRSEFDARSAWAASLNTELESLRPQFAQVSAERDSIKAERDSVQAERDLMRSSLSWQLTKPLRYAMRKLRATRTRAAFALSRLRAAVHRTRGSLASRGLNATIARAADEFRRPATLPAAPVASEPGEDFSPFTLPTSTTPRVSIVIPVFGKIAYTIACLRSLVEHASDTLFEVIVVDDASPDATPDRLARIDGIRVVRNPCNLGFVGSCNAGAKSAVGEYIVFLNNDTVVTPGWLDALLQCFAQESQAGLVGAQLVYPDGRLQEAGGIVFSDGSGWNYGRLDDPADPRYAFRREVDYCSGAAIMLPRALFTQLGGFDERYAPAYYEDTDLAFGVRAAGKKVFYEPRSRVVHFEGVTAGTDTGSGMKRYQVINRSKFQEKWQDKLALQPAPIHAAKAAGKAANWRSRGRVLIIDAYTPTPDQDSGSLRMLNLMRLLRELGYAVNFLPDNRAHAGRYTHALQALGIEAMYHPFVSNPIAWLRERGSDLDAIVLSRHYVAVNYIGAARLYAPQARLIFDTVDLHYLREQRAAALSGNSELAQQSARTRVQELKLMRECDVSLVVSNVESELLAREVPQARIEVLSNVHEVHGRRREFDARHDLVFVGGFQHPPNTDAVLWFVNDVFPLVRAQLANVNFHVIGSKAPAQILELAHDGVIVHGFVEDIAPFMDASRLSLAPLRYGAGVKGKVNMAMSYGLPVVATNCAVEGMHVRTQLDSHDPDVLVADSPAEFAAAIARAYNDANLWNTLSDNGLKNVREHFSFDAARAALLRILAD